MPVTHIISATLMISSAANVSYIFIVLEVYF